MQDALRILALIETHQTEIETVLATKRPFPTPDLQAHHTTFATLKQSVETWPADAQPTQAQQAAHTNAGQALDKAANDFFLLTENFANKVAPTTTNPDHHTRSSPTKPQDDDPKDVRL